MGASQSSESYQTSKDEPVQYPRQLKGELQTFWDGGGPSQSSSTELIVSHAEFEKELQRMHLKLSRVVLLDDEDKIVTSYDDVLKESLAKVLEAGKLNNILRQINDKLTAACDEKDGTINRLNREIEELEEAQDDEGLKKINELLTKACDLSQEKIELMQEVIDTRKDLVEAVNLVKYLKALINEQKEAIERAAKLRQGTKRLREDCEKFKQQADKNIELCGKVQHLEENLKQAKTENKKLKQQVDKNSDLRARIHYLEEQLKGENVEQLRAENIRLMSQDDKVNELQQENDELRDNQRESKAQVKQLKGELRFARTHMQKAQSRSCGIHNAAQPAIEDAQGYSSDEGAYAVGTTFAEVAVELFKAQKTALRGLRQMVSDMTDARGGSGWSIVERTEKMVQSTTSEMLKGIDACLALRNVVQQAQDREEERVEQLNTQGFPALRSVVRGVGSLHDTTKPALGSKKSKKDLRGRTK